MFWHVSFWFLVALIVLPFPFKIYGYINGSDKSPLIVKIEELVSVTLMTVGLIAFYGFLNDQMYISPTFWKIWLFIALLMTFTSCFWSPKLVYAKEVMGDNKMRIAALIGCFMYAPLFLAVYLYAF